MKLLSLFTISICLAGCVSRLPPTAFVFPAAEDLNYHAPDGRIWVRHDMTQAKDGNLTLVFTPAHVKPGEWSEMLLFLRGNHRIGLSEAQARLEKVRKDLDHDATFSYVGDDSVYLQVYYFPKWKESGVSKVVRSVSGYNAVAYQQRLGVGGESMLKRWRRILRDWPNQALLPTTTAVTPPARQEARQP